MKSRTWFGGRVDDTRDRGLIVACVGLALVVLATCFRFRYTFPRWRGFVPCCVGAVVALVVSLLANQRRWRLLPTVAVGAAVMVLVGAVVTFPGDTLFGLPTPVAISHFFEGAVRGWADMLTSAPPPRPSGYVLTVPYLSAWIGTFAGLQLLLRSRQIALPLIGPLCSFALTSLFGTSNRSGAVLHGAISVVAVFLFLTIRSFSLAPRVLNEGRQSRARPAQVAASVVLVGMSALLVGPHVPLPGSRDRFDLRELKTPPFDPQEWPSPLTELKGYRIEESAGRKADSKITDAPCATNTPTDAERALFTASGTGVGLLDRWRVATLDSFDGRVWSAGAKGEYRAAGPDLESVRREAGAAKTIKAAVTIGRLNSVWVPVIGTPRRVARTGDSAAVDLRVRTITGDLAASSALAPGVAYQLTALVPESEPSIDAIRNATATREGDVATDALLPAGDAEVDSFAKGLRVLADAMSPPSSKDGQRVEDIRFALASGRYDPDAATGHSYGQMLFFLNSYTQQGGYYEQYAAAMALLVRSIGIPARVIVGFRTPPSAPENGPAVFGGCDMQAWVEVHFDKLGWVPFDPTPAQDQKPDELASTQTEGSKPAEEAPVPESSTGATPPPDEHDGQGGRSIWLFAAGLVALFVLARLVAVAAVVVRKKLLSRRRHRAADPALQIAGAWREVIDRALEMGLPVARGSTYTEAAETVAAELPADRETLVQLVDLADRSAFHRNPPSSVEADRGWALSRTLVRHLRGHAGIMNRLRMIRSTAPMQWDRAAVNEPSVAGWFTDK